MPGSCMSEPGQIQFIGPNGWYDSSTNAGDAKHLFSYDISSNRTIWPGLINKILQDQIGDDIDKLQTWNKFDLFVLKYTWCFDGGLIRKEHVLNCVWSHTCPMSVKVGCNSRLERITETYATTANLKHWIESLDSCKHSRQNERTLAQGKVQRKENRWNRRLDIAQNWRVTHNHWEGEGMLAPEHAPLTWPQMVSNPWGIISRSGTGWED